MAKKSPKEWYDLLPQRKHDPRYKTLVLERVPSEVIHAFNYAVTVVTNNEYFAGYFKQLSPDERRDARIEVLEKMIEGVVDELCLEGAYKHIVENYHRRRLKILRARMNARGQREDERIELDPK